MKRRFVYCIRCGRRFRGVALCFDCEVFMSKQQKNTPGYKKTQRREAFRMITSGQISRIRPGVYKVKDYKTSWNVCTCASGRYRGLHARVCKHQCAVELLESRRGR